MALPRSARLRDGRRIRAVSSHGARARAGDLLVSAVVPALPGSGPPGSGPLVSDSLVSDSLISDSPSRGSGRRVAVVVGRRTGGAVERNRQRRRLHHAVAALLPGLPADVDLVLRPVASVIELSPEELRVAVRSGVRRAIERANRTAASGAAP